MSSIKGRPSVSHCLKHDLRNFLLGSSPHVGRRQLATHGARLDPSIHLVGDQGQLVAQA